MYYIVQYEIVVFITCLDETSSFYYNDYKDKNKGSLGINIEIDREAIMNKVCEFPTKISLTSCEKN